MTAPESPHASVDQRPFGSCCRRLKDALDTALGGSFHIESNGVLFFPVRIATTPDGPARYMAPVMFCPFCGSALQTRETIARAGCIRVP